MIFIELLMVTPIIEERALAKTTISAELLYSMMIIDADEEAEETEDFNTPTVRPSLPGAYAIDGYSTDLPIRAVEVFDSIEDFKERVRPVRNGERAQLAIEDSIMIITAKFSHGEWTWIGV